MSKVKVTCPDCNTIFEFEPERVKVFRSLPPKDEPPKAKKYYKTCPKGHKNMYEVRTN